MADPSGARPYREAIAQLRAAHAEKSREELLELVCQLTKTYVLDQTIPYDIPLPERDEAPARVAPREERADPMEAPVAVAAAEDESEPAWRRFARLIDGIKRRTGLPQLESLSIQADGKAVLVVDNQKITFGERVTVEFVPRRGIGDGGRPAGAAPEQPAPEPARPAPATRPAPSRPAQPSRPAAPPRGRGEPPKKADPAPPSADGVGDRFRGLELD